MLEKKTIKAVEVRRLRPISRLIKCYVCNQHFDQQGKFDLHIKQHQSKLSRTNVDQIQRKTQESFNRHRQVAALNKTQTIETGNCHSATIEKEKETKPYSEEEAQDEREQEEIEEALRESQILLEKIEFMTQIVPPQSPTSAPQITEEEVQYFEKTIEGEKKLYGCIVQAGNSANIQKLILETQFEMRYFQSYQDQLYHLRVLASAAANPDSISKIISIRKNICRDICLELQKQFKFCEVQPVRPLKRAMEPRLIENTGQLEFCADCLSEIGAEEQMYSLGCGHCYHVDCFNGFCCG